MLTLNSKTIVTFLAILFLSGLLFYVYSSRGEQKELSANAIQDEQGFTEEVDPPDLFSREINIQDYSYLPPEFLYKDGGYTYYVYLRETEGSMPIVKESSTTKEYTGVRSSWNYSFSPDKRRLALIHAPIPGEREALCLVHIDPKLIKCVALISPNETFTKDRGDYGEPVMNNEWLDNSTIKVSVYREQTGQIGQGYSAPTEIIRTQILRF